MSLLLLVACIRGTPSTSDDTAPDSGAVVDTAEEPDDTGDSIDPVAPDPWEALDAEAGDGLRKLIVTELPWAIQPDEILALPERSLSVVRDQRVVHILDPFYRHDPSMQCVPAGGWPEWGHEERQGRCREGQVETQRGALRTAAGVADVSGDRDGLRIAVLEEGGALHVANADLLAGNPLDYLRFTSGPSLGAATQLALDGERLWVAEGATLRALALADGSEQASVALDSAVRDIQVLHGHTWALTAGGLWRDGVQVWTGDASGVAVGDAVALTVADAVVVLDDDGGAVLERHEIADLVGVAALGPDQRVYAPTARGVLAVGGGAPEALAAPGASVVAASSSHEVLVLGDAGVEVYLDDGAVDAGAPPLQLAISAFLESPASERQDIPCTDGGEDGDMAQSVQRAAASARLLADLPAAVAMGITPHLARRVRECGEEEIIGKVLDNERLQVGVLFHDVPTQCDQDDVDCLAAAFETQAGRVTQLGAGWAFSAGVQSMTPRWPEVLLQLDAPPRVMFSSLSAFPEIDHHKDPRAKEAWPLAAGERSTVQYIDTLSDLAPAGSLSEGGALAVHPGNSVSAFNLSGCANLLVRECKRIRAGGASEFSEADLAVLSLMVHRAVSERGEGVSSWSFHLPDLATYNYTEGCAAEQRLWSQDCQAGRLQAWAFDVHRRYVLNGLAAWATPAR